ncbi:MAG TPA: hypothetical protein VEK08_20510 [Planctomycetota bacterium]|nr:hypothetical protein [Planctomycetota bacterium]
MAKVKVTPDAQLITAEAIKIRIEQLEKELATTTHPTDVRQLNGRIRALKTRLEIGPEKTGGANSGLLASKSDLM